MVIPSVGVIVDKSRNADSIFLSTNVFMLTTDINTINNNCINPANPIPNVFPNTIFLAFVYVTSVSTIFDVFSVVIDVDT